MTLMDLCTREPDLIINIIKVYAQGQIQAQLHSSPTFGLHHTTGASRDLLKSLKQVKILVPFPCLLKDMSSPCLPCLAFSAVLGTGKHQICSCPLQWGWSQLGTGTMAARVAWGVGGVGSSSTVTGQGCGVTTPQMPFCHCVLHS